MLGEEEMLDLVYSLKFLAEELIKDDQVEEGILRAEQALKLQNIIYEGKLNSDIEETMILLAEAYTLGQNEQKAIDIYEKLV